MLKLKGFLDRLTRSAAPTQGLTPFHGLSDREAYTACFENLLLNHEIRSVIDCGCGEFNFTHLPYFQNVQYVGLDWDPRLVAFNADRHRGPNLRFACVNILTTVFPGADLFLCKDLFNHLPTEIILDLLKDLPTFQWALFTYRKGSNDERSDFFPEEGSGYAPLDLGQPPFSLPGTEILAMTGGHVCFLMRGGGEEPGSRAAFAQLFAGEAMPVRVAQVPDPFSLIPEEPLLAESLAQPIASPAPTLKESHMPNICLNMIVKNEAKLIRRCLDSVLPYISSWVIMDTGSTDGTQDLVREHLRSLPGELFERPWTNFGQARTEALERVGDRAEYILIMDADDFLVCDEGFTFPPLEKEAYFLDFQLGHHTYRRVCLVSRHLPWRYEGVLHEYLEAGRPFSSGILNGAFVMASCEGGRSADPDKYLKDARILEQALAEAPTNTRYAFYLAQSYRSAGLLEESLAAYQHRATMGGFDEEVYIALLDAALLMEQLGRPEQEVIQAFLKAYEARPTRAEALCGLARFLRLKGQNHLACLFAEKAAALPQPPDLLFVDTSVYRWRALDEFSVAAYWVGRFQECQRVCSYLLAANVLQEADQPRVAANLQFALNALGHGSVMTQLCS